MKHLIDYEILKDWGFEWGAKDNFNGEDICTLYILSDTGHTDMFGFEPIILQMFPDFTLGHIWVLSAFKKDVKTLFTGVIGSKEALKQILKSCIVFKPNKK